MGRTVPIIRAELAALQRDVELFTALPDPSKREKTLNEYLHESAPAATGVTAGAAGTNGHPRPAAPHPPTRRGGRSQRARVRRGCQRCGIARRVNVLLAVLTIGLSGVVGVAQLRMFRRTHRTWRLLFAIAALTNSAGAIVVLTLLLTGFYG